MIQVIKQSNESNIIFFKLASEKKEAEICIDRNGVNVLCLNASHKAYGGSGRYFENLESALEAYRSRDMKEMISLAIELTKKPKSTIH